MVEDKGDKRILPKSFEEQGVVSIRFDKDLRESIKQMLSAPYYGGKSFSRIVNDWVRDRIKFEEETRSAFTDLCISDAATALFVPCRYFDHPQYAPRITAGDSVAASRIVSYLSRFKAPEQLRIKTITKQESVGEYSLKEIATYVPSDQDQLGNIIALGGKDMNTAVDMILQGVGKYYPNILKRDPRIVRKPETQCLTLPDGTELRAQYDDDKMSRIKKDYGYMLKAPSPFHANRYIYWLLGVRHIGTQAIAEAALRPYIYGEDLSPSFCELWISCDVLDNFLPINIEVVHFVNHDKQA